MAEHRFALSEYERRWDAVRAAAAAEELDAVIVWSRGGSNDAYSDVFYLANFYTLTPHGAPDLLPYWAGKSHCALLVQPDREPILVVDVPDYRRDLVPVERVVVDTQLPQAVAKVAAEQGLAAARLGIVGAHELSASAYGHLAASLPDAAFVFTDHLVEQIRMHKSEVELEVVREAARAGNAVLGAIIDAARDGARTEGDAVAAGFAAGIPLGVAFIDAAVSSGPLSNYYAYGRLPSWTDRELRRGDLFHADTYGSRAGYRYDISRSTVVGGSPTDAQADVITGVATAVQAGVGIVRAGVRAGDIWRTISDELARRGLGSEVGAPDGNGEAVVQMAGFAAHGHGFGVGWDPPRILRDEPTVLAPGMCLAIEAMAGRDDVGSALYEQNVIVTEDGAEVLTDLPTM